MWAALNGLAAAQISPLDQAEWTAAHGGPPLVESAHDLAKLPIGMLLDAALTMR